MGKRDEKWRSPVDEHRRAEKQRLRRKTQKNKSGPHEENDEGASDRAPKKRPRIAPQARTPTRRVPWGWEESDRPEQSGASAPVDPLNPVYGFDSRAESRERAGARGRAGAGGQAGAADTGLAGHLLSCAEKPEMPGRGEAARGAPRRFAPRVVASSVRAVATGHPKEGPSDLMTAGVASRTSATGGHLATPLRNASMTEEQERFGAEMPVGPLVGPERPPPEGSDGELEKEIGPVVGPERPSGDEIDEVAEDEIVPVVGPERPPDDDIDEVAEDEIGPVVGPERPPDDDVEEEGEGFSDERESCPPRRAGTLAALANYGDESDDSAESDEGGKDPQGDPGTDGDAELDDFMSAINSAQASR